MHHTHISHSISIFTIFILPSAMQQQSQIDQHHHQSPAALPTSHTKVAFSFNSNKKKTPPPRRSSATSAFTSAAAMDLEDEEDEEEVGLGMEVFPPMAVPAAATRAATELKDDNSNIEPPDGSTAAAEEDDEEELTTQTHKVQASLQAISLDNKTTSSNTNMVVPQQAQAQIDALREEGNERALAGAFRSALELFEAALGLDPRSSLLYELKAQSHLQLEEWYEAVKAARRAVELAPEWGEGRLTLGRALMQMGEVRDAVKELSSLLGKTPSTAPLHAEAREELIYATGALMELQRREADFDLQLSGRAGLDLKELEVAQCKRNLLARGLNVSSDCFLGGSEGSFGEQEGKHNEQESAEEEDEEEGW